MLKKKPATVRLPNGMEVVCARPEEATLVFEEVGSYLKHGLSLHPGDIVLDVGANIGLFSLWAYSHCEKDAQIYAFEPVPQIADLLEENLRRMGNPKLKALRYGLSRAAGQVKFSFRPNATFASTAYPDDGELALTELLLSRSIDRLPRPLRIVRYMPGPLRRACLNLISRFINREVPVTCELRTLSQVIREHTITRIDLLKIDAEKSELDVLEGIEDEHWERIQQAFVEVHERQGRLAQIKELFQRNGFQNIIIEQDEFFAGTEIYALYAMRESASPPEGSRRL